MAANPAIWGNIEQPSSGDFRVYWMTPELASTLKDSEERLGRSAVVPNFGVGPQDRHAACRVETAKPRANAEPWFHSENEIVAIFDA
jgi:hypothetical protein